MMQRTILLLLFFCPGIIFCQDIFHEWVGSCDTKKFVCETDSVFSRSDCHKLLDDICSNLNPKHLKRLRGEIYVQVIVDTLGNPCVLSYEQRLNLSIAQELIQIVNKKTLWAPPVYRNKRECASAMFCLIFGADGVVIRRLGLIWGKGFRDLDKYEMKKG